MEPYHRVIAMVAVFGVAAVSCLRPADPRVERGSLRIDAVKRGPMTRDNVDALPAGDVLYVGLPTSVHAGDALGIFRVLPNYDAAERITVQFGRAATNVIEIKRGTKVGDSLILNDMSPYDAINRIRLK